MKERIAAVIPVYNVETYVNRCIESVCKQSYPNLEIILVDDGSTDQSGAICDEWARQDERIRVFHTPNAGLSAARNYGVAHAKSDWVTFIDSDDFVTPVYVEQLNSIREDTGCQIAVTKAKKVNEEDADRLYAQNDSQRSLSESVTRMTVPEAIANMYYRKGIPIYAPAKLFARQFLLDHPFHVGEQYEDLSVMHYLFSEADVIGFSPAENYLYLQRTGSIVNSNFSQKKMIQIPICSEIHEFIKVKYPETLKAAESKQFMVALNLYVEARNSHADQKTCQDLKREIRKYASKVRKDSNNSLPVRMIAGTLPVSLAVLPAGMRLLRKAQSKGWIRINSPF